MDRYGRDAVAGPRIRPIDIDYLPITCRLALRQLDVVIDTIIAVPSHPFNDLPLMAITVKAARGKSISERANRRKGGGVIHSVQSIHSGPSTAYT